MYLPPDQNIKVGIYARLASQDPTGAAISETQLDRAKSFVEETFYMPRIKLKVYRDEASSSHGAIGAGLEQLLYDARKREIDIVVITSLDRLSRDYQTNTLIRYALENAGVKLLTI